MRKSPVFLLCLLFYISSNAQPAKSFHEGYYYNNSDLKISGLISYKSYEDYIHFKTDSGTRREKIKIEDIKALVIPGFPVDSQTVLTEDNKEKKKYFAKLFLTTPSMRFYHKFIAYSYGGGPSMSIRGTAISGSTGSQPAFHNNIVWSNSPGYSGNGTLIMYQDGNTTYELTKRNYVDVLNRAFANDPEVLKEIQNKDFSFKKVKDLLIMYRSKH